MVFIVDLGYFTALYMTEELVSQIDIPDQSFIFKDWISLLVGFMLNQRLDWELYKI